MPIAGIISEYNPFHRGHMYQFEAVRGLLGPDTGILCVMSGNCVQRGDLAVFHKLARAEAAVRCGADLVIELPAPYVLGSAEPFARGGVGLLAATGVVTHLSFGCETEDLEGLSAVAGALDEPEVQTAIKLNLGRGMSYGTACQRVLDDRLPPDRAELAARPNNLLGIEYLRALAGTEGITPLPILREGVDHDSMAADGMFASATHLRRLLLDGDRAVWGYMPEPAAAIFHGERSRGRGPAALDLVDSAVLSILRLHSQPPMGGWLDDSEGLSRRIITMANRAGSLDELVGLVKTRRYHASRIRRLVLKMCLGMGAGDRPDAPLYIRILAANERGRDMIRQINERATLPVITLPKQVAGISDRARRMMELESAVTDVQALAWRKISRRQGGSEWRCGPRMVGI